MGLPRLPRCLDLLDDKAKCFPANDSFCTWLAHGHGQHGLSQDWHWSGRIPGDKPPESREEDDRSSGLGEPMNRKQEGWSGSVVQWVAGMAERPCPGLQGVSSSRLPTIRPQTGCPCQTLYRDENNEWSPSWVLWVVEGQPPIRMLDFSKPYTGWITMGFLPPHRHQMSRASRHARQLCTWWDFML